MFRRFEMTKIQSSGDYKEFMKGFLKRDDAGQVSPPDSFDVLIENQGRWKSYRFVYDSETKWCGTHQQANDIIRKNRHVPTKDYASSRKIMDASGQENLQLH
jgi:hypothetical protein